MPGDGGFKDFRGSAGIRWMCLKNVSLDISFKYRWAQPTFKYNPAYFFSETDADDVEEPSSYTLKPTYHLFSRQVGVAYHF